jgi:hypothetical protein
MATKTKYEDHAAEAALPIAERPESVRKRDGTMTRVRRHHMSMDDQAEYRKLSAEAGRFIAPYRRGGGYWGIIETLSLLGENQEHSFGAFWTKFMEVMSADDLKDKSGRTPWESFSGRPLRSETTGRNVIDKVHQNIRVLQRLGGANPYGLKLAQMNACIDVLGSKTDMRLKLRTQIADGETVLPVREVREREFVPSTVVPAGYCVAEGVGDTRSVAVTVERAMSASSSTGGSAEIKEEVEVGSGKG